MSTTSTPAQTLSSVAQFVGPDVSIASAEGVLGFHGSAPVAKQTVTGARDDGTALESLLNALEALGLIVDNSTAT